MDSILLSTSYLPPISWIAKALKYPDVRIEIYETYPKQTFRNRCTIATASGILSLTVPVKRINGNHTITADIVIDNSKNWQQVHWRSIVSAYNKSPYFIFYRDLFEPVFNMKHDKLIDLNHSLLNIVLKLLNLTYINVNFTSDYAFETNFHDLRNSFSAKLTLLQTETNKPQRYLQVFEEIHGFIPDLSIIDLLFNLGPEALFYLQNNTILVQPQVNEL